MARGANGSIRKRDQRFAGDKRRGIDRHGGNSTVHESIVAHIRLLERKVALEGRLLVIEVAKALTEEPVRLDDPGLIRRVQGRLHTAAALFRQQRIFKALAQDDALRRIVRRF